MKLKDFVKDNILILDGAMGTMLQEMGLKAGENPEVFNLTSPEVVKKVHLAYLDAGSNMVITNTFGANSRKFPNNKEIISSAISIAKEAASAFNGYVALDIGPIGELLEPMGTLRFEEAYELYKEQVIIGRDAGVDAIYIETMTDLHEAKCAVLAAKENSDLPVFCTMSFEKNMRTFVGTSVCAMAITLEGLGADFIGINCSLGPAQMMPMVEELVKWTNIPIILKPNAGLPVVANGKTVFDAKPEQFAHEISKMIDLGVSVVGGCCGTTPQHINLLKRLNKKPPRREKVEVCAVCSSSKTVEIDRIRVVGERINPTGKKRFQQALKNNDIDYILNQATQQQEAGADILDVNVGLPGIDEKNMMVTVIKAVQSIIKAPLQIDSSNPEVIEAALRVYNGKAIMNSVNGDDDVLEKILPIVKKYGAAVVGLTLDKNGIPQTAEQRFNIAEKIVCRAAEFGISKNDVFIDCLTLTASAEQALVFETLKAVSLVKQRLHVKTVLGVSNISFGLPARDKMNQVFLTAALSNGLDLPIINPNSIEMMDTIYCFHQLKNIDRGSREYIKRFTDTTPIISKTTNDIAYYIKNGLKEETKACAVELLSSMDGLTLVNQLLMPALDEVGIKYEKNEIFLPQLLQSAEAAKEAFELVRSKMSSQSGLHVELNQKIILATVKGDIHDIGKNIVKVVLENYGYSVIDLGRDVPIQTVIEESIKNRVKLVGLSALMTTTLLSMEETINALKKRDAGIKVMVGGAVLTQSYAKQIGADFYAKDAMSSVAIAKDFFGGKVFNAKK